MTNDVKEAADKVRQCEELAARVTLARAYLSENDETPITEDWLRSVGFEWCNGEQCFLLPVDQSEQPECLCYYRDRYLTLGKKGAAFFMRTRGQIAMLRADVLSRRSMAS